VTSDLQTAVERRALLPPDLALGPVQLWFGSSLGSVWLDTLLVLQNGAQPLEESSATVLRRALIAFVPQLAALDAGTSHEARLWSDGSLFSLTLQRAGGGFWCAVWQRRFAGDPLKSEFLVTPAELTAAVRGARGILARLDNVERNRWRPRPERISGKAIAALDPGGEGESVAFEYIVDGVGWFAVNIVAGDRRGGFGGSSWELDGLTALLDAALLALDGIDYECTFDAEPSLTRVKFAPAYRSCPGPIYRDGFWLRVQEVDHFTEEPRKLRFEAQCRSNIQLAEAIYRMALPHFVHHARPDAPALARLEDALAAVLTNAEGR
jgi:hypothetical protein